MVSTFLIVKKNPILKCLFVSGVLPICLLVCFLPPPKNINIKEMLTLNVWKKTQQLWCINFWNLFIVCHPVLTPVSSDVCFWRTEKYLLRKNMYWMCFSHLNFLKNTVKMFQWTLEHHEKNFSKYKLKVFWGWDKLTKIEF